MGGYNPWMAPLALGPRGVWPRPVCLLVYIQHLEYFYFPNFEDILQAFPYRLWIVMQET